MLNFLWSDVPLLYVPAKKNSKNVVAFVGLKSSDVVFSHGCVSCLELKPDYQVNIFNASLNREEKKT